MIITCQKCSTSYHLDETLLKPEGTKVRCTVCKYIFKAYPPLETSLEHKQNYMASSQNEIESQIDSSLTHTDEMEFPDDLARALERNLNDNDFDDEESNGQLPSNLVFEIDEEEDIYFDEAVLEDSIKGDDDNFQDSSYDEPFEEDNFDISDSTFDLSDDFSDDDIAKKDELTSEDLELSPEDLDLVKGYSSTKYNDFKEEDNLSTSKGEKEDSKSEVTYEDEPVTLSEEDLDLGVSMAAQALDEANPSDTNLIDEDTIFSETEKDTRIDIEQDLSVNKEQVDKDQNNQPINIGAELDLEFESELENELSESESPLSEDLDMELSLDDSEPLPAQTNEKQNKDEGDDEELSLGVDFEEIYGDENLVNDTDSADNISTTAKDDHKETISKQGDFDLDIDFENNLDEQVSNEDFDLSIDKNDDLDLNLDFDDIEESSEGSEEDLDLTLVNNKNDDLDLNLDFDDIEESSEGSEEDLDLTLVNNKNDDLDLNLDFDDIGESLEGSEEDLDLTLVKDNDFDFDDAEENHNEPEKDLDLTLAKDEDFDLDLDFDDAEENHNEPEKDLDLTLAKDEDFDLDLDFDGSESESNEDIDLTMALKDDLNLDQKFEDTKKETVSEDSLDFELDLDDNQENIKTISNTDISDKNLDFDLDIDGSLGKMSSTDDLDLSDLQELLDTDKAKEKQSVSTDESDKLDFSDLESELENEQEDEHIADDQDLELDFDIGSNLTKTTEGSSEEEFSTELDLSEFEYLSDSNEKSPADDHFDTGDMELEFQIEENTTTSPLKTKDESKNDVTLSEFSEETDEKNSFFQDAHSSESIEEYDEFDESAYPSKKGDINKYLIFIFILAVLLGGGYSAYVLLDGLNIQIPILSNYFNPKVEDPGNLKLSTEDINSKFIDNATGGRMFVITGKVKSGYDKPRRFIRMTGKLFTKGKKIAKTEVVYCGNMVTDDELTSMDIAILKKRLADRFGGDKKANTTIQPGSTLPFMVIFSDLPKEQLEEFTIEVDQSAEIN